MRAGISSEKQLQEKLSHLSGLPFVQPVAAGHPGFAAGAGERSDTSDIGGTFGHARSRPVHPED